MLRCARGIARALGPGGTLSRQAGGFIYQDPANLIVVWNGQVVYEMSDLDDDALCARLTPALNAAGYALLPRTGPLSEHSIIATIPGAQAIDLSPHVDPATDDAVAPEAEAHDPSPFDL